MQIRQCAESFVTLLRALYRGMEQLVARQAHNLEVGRFESPSRNTTKEP